MNILLHICCAPCSTEVIERLQNDGYEVKGFFYNPNIQPKEEYEKRLDDARKYTHLAEIDLIEGDYDDSTWIEKTNDYKNEPEGGKRCKICYELRLLKTGEIAKLKNFDFFTSTLTISPYKNAKDINEIGIEISKKIGVKYLESDFKKKDGYYKSICKSKEAGLYRQDYCGCSYSKLESESKSKKIQ
ncbi:MAG: epoxyqueuosine reductase QueH [Thermoplasmata archaeon]|nr:MAG: epoxyqueuosine reductase QueH [Thermoplasmata archaeon]